MARPGRAEPSRRRGAEPIGDLLPGALRALGVPSRAASRRVQDAWSRVADPRWLDRSRPLSLQGGVLSIAVSSSPLREELAQYHAPRLLQALRTALSDDRLVAVRFVAAAEGNR